MQVLELTPATTYKCRIVATNGEGESSKGEESQFVTKPDAPERPTPPLLKGSSGTELHLEWPVPVSNGADITGYTVQRRVAGNTWEHCTSCSGPETSVPKGTVEETVFFRVNAINSGGTSDWSEESDEIKSEKAARKLLLMVSNDDGLFAEKKKVNHLFQRCTIG